MYFPFEYIFLAIFCIWIIFLIYVKIKSPFWFHQPVFHSYQIYPRLFARNPYIIRTNLPRKGIYCDFNHILTERLSQTQSSKNSDAIDLLQCHYLSSENVLFILNQKQFEIQFNGQTHSSFISFYYDNESVQYLRNERSVILEQRCTKPIGMITSRVTRFYFRSETPFYLYFWDYICIHRNYKNTNKNLSRYLIQTHEYNQRHENREIAVSLLKKENTLCEGVIPLVEYDTILFPLYHDSQISKLPIRFIIKRIGQENISKWMDILESIRELGCFDILILSDISVYIELILSELWYIYYLCFLNPATKQEEIMSIYIFKNITTIYDHEQEHESREDEQIEIEKQKDGGNTIQCIASVRINPVLSDVVFFRGFLHSLREVIILGKYKMIFIENISHNGILLEKWREKYSTRISHPCAYYLYNYVIPSMTFSSEKTLILL